MEAAAYFSLRRAPGGSGDGSSSGASGAPSRPASLGLLGAGVQEVAAAELEGPPPPAFADGDEDEPAGGEQAGADAAAGSTLPLPFLVVRRAEGVTLGSCMDALSSSQLAAVAAAAGHALVAFHRLPLPPGGGGGGAAATAWVARDGIAYSSAACTLDLREEEAGSLAELRSRQRRALGALFPCAAAALLGEAAGGDAAGGAADASGAAATSGDSTSMSGGAYFGIALACLVGVVAVGGTALYVHRRRSRQSRYQGFAETGLTAVSSREYSEWGWGWGWGWPPGGPPCGEPGVAAALVAVGRATRRSSAACPTTHPRPRPGDGPRPMGQDFVTSRMQF